MGAVQPCADLSVDYHGYLLRKGLRPWVKRSVAEGRGVGSTLAGGEGLVRGRHCADWDTVVDIANVTCESDVGSEAEL